MNARKCRRLRAQRRKRVQRRQIVPLVRYLSMLDGFQAWGEAFRHLRPSEKSTHISYRGEGC